MFIFCVLLFSKLLREQFTLMDFEVVDLKLEVSSSSGNGNGGGGGGSSPEKSGEENSGEHKKQVRLGCCKIFATKTLEVLTIPWPSVQWRVT
jgi:hypothetical protein